jgi:hypothetical protein
MPQQIRKLVRKCQTCPRLGRVLRWSGGEIMKDGGEIMKEAHQCARL